MSRDREFSDLMKICFLTIRNLKTHANMKRAFSMSKHLLNQGHQVAIVLEEHEENRKAAEQHPGIEYVFFPRSSVLKENRIKRELLKSRQDDVLIVGGNSARNFVWLRGKNRPVLILDHPEIVSSFQDRKLPRRTWEYLREWLEIFVFDGHLAVSRFIEKRLRYRVGLLRKRAAILYSPFAADDDLREFQPEAVEAIKHKYGKKIVLYLGKFLKAYGFHEILRAAALLKERRSDFVIVLAGAGPELDAGTNFVEQNELTEQVIFPGYLSGEVLKSHLYGAHAFISPMNDTVRDWARSPGKIYMYAATQRPVITCRIGEAADTLGEAGFYYELGSVDSLAEQIDAALDRDDSPVTGYSVERLFWERRTTDLTQWLRDSFPLQ